VIGLYAVAVFLVLTCYYNARINTTVTETEKIITVIVTVIVTEKLELK